MLIGALDINVSCKAEWETEFDRYKAFPEWQQRRSMTLEEFKYIFFWEVRNSDRRCQLRVLSCDRL